MQLDRIELFRREGPNLFHNIDESIRNNTELDTVSKGQLKTLGQIFSSHSEPQIYTIAEPTKIESGIFVPSGKGLFIESNNSILDLNKTVSNNQTHSFQYGDVLYIDSIDGIRFSVDSHGPYYLIHFPFPQINTGPRTRVRTKQQRISIGKRTSQDLIQQCNNAGLSWVQFLERNGTSLVQCYTYYLDKIKDPHEKARFIALSRNLSLIHGYIDVYNNLSSYPHFDPIADLALALQHQQDGMSELILTQHLSRPYTSQNIYKLLQVISQYGTPELFARVHSNRSEHVILRSDLTEAAINSCNADMLEYLIDNGVNLPENALDYAYNTPCFEIMKILAEQHPEDFDSIVENYEMKFDSL